MARLRTQSAWEGGGSEERMRLYLRGEHHPQQALARRVALVAEGDNALVGFIAGHLTTRFGCDGELQWLLVALEARGGPTATLLWETLRDWFIEQRARRVCVNVALDNSRACRFYARMGATPLSEHWMAWDDVAERA
jgi:GNAT superfamily N-acetyltransferase